MTIERDYAKNEDQQVPDGRFEVLTKDSGGTVIQQKVTQGIPDFDTLLTDLAAVGALDTDIDNPSSSTSSSNFESLNLDSSQDLMDLAYTERSFYDDYGVAHIKKEPCSLDSKTVELALLKNASAPPQPTPAQSQESLYSGDPLGLLTSDETSYSYNYQTVRVPQSGEPGMTGDLNLPSEEPFSTEYLENEMIQKIDRASVELGISKNPYQWECEHSHRWAEWTVRLYNLPVSYVMDFYMDGTQMCMLSLEDFQKRCPEFGDYLHAELELWKSAYSYISSPLHSSGNSSSSDEDELKYHNLDDDLSGSAQSFPGLTATTSTALPPTHRTSLPVQASTTISNNLSSIPTPVIISPISHMGAPPTQAVHTSSSSSAYYGRSSHTEPTLLQAAQGHRMLVGTGSLPRGIQTCVSPAPSSESLGSSGHGSWSSSSPGAMHEDRVEDMSSLLADSTCEPPHMGRGKHAIHLWQFLKELLLQPHAYHNCIRWLDRSKGIFKIEDSTRVAKLWGQRKNRPAMNYDKLSRSIRQYYKKGIIKKTENSKRLVYQFQPQYR